ncbi:MAG: extracellular solute-binding protein, partial [Bacillota bacterium]
FSLYNWPPVAGKGVLEPLDAYVEEDNYDLDDFYPQIIKPYRYDGKRFGQGKLYGLPKEIAIRAFYYNVDMWREAGLREPDPSHPMSWEEYLAALKALTKRDGRRVTQYGLVSDDWWGIWAIWAWANGGEMVDDPWKPTKATLDDPKVIEGLEFFARLATEHGVLVPLAVAAEQGKSEMFASRRAACYYNGRWMVPLFRQSRGLNFEVMPTPSGKAGPAQLLTGSMFGVSATSKHKEAAWKLLSYVVGKQGQVEMTKLGLLLPSRRSVAESDLFLKSTPPHNNQVFINDLKYTRILPLHPKYMEMEKVVGDEFKLALVGEKSVADAMKSANEKVNQLLQSK